GGGVAAAGPGMDGAEGPDGAAGGAAGGGTARRRERTSMAPPAIRATTTRAMTMIRYTITAPVWQMDRPAAWSGRSGSLALPEPLAHHGGHPVALHAGPVQRVRDLHGPLLVRDDDQLGTGPQLLEDRQQPLQVGVVQRRL